MTDRLILQMASVSGCANTVNPFQGLKRRCYAGNPCFMIAKYGLLQFQYEFEPILVFFPSQIELQKETLCKYDNSCYTVKSHS